MDLNQQKLTKIEWDTTEIPVSKEEKEILDLIVKGYHDVNIIYNKTILLLIIYDWNQMKTSCFNYIKIILKKQLKN